MAEVTDVGLAARVDEHVFGEVGPRLAGVAAEHTPPQPEGLPSDRVLRRRHLHLPTTVMISVHVY